jgi:hypothetical protein
MEIQVGMSNILFQVKRTWVDACILGLMGLLLYWTKGIDEPVLRLFAFKVLLFSASQLHAHITRHLMFPYIQFSRATKFEKMIVVTLHASAAYLYAQGG